MALRITGIGKAITAIIRRQSKVIMDRTEMQTKVGLIAAAVEWQQVVRNNLNVLVPKPWNSSTPRNLSKWPKRRTGKLYFSILKPKLAFQKRTNQYTSKYGISTLAFSLSTFYGPIADSGYGNDLNTMSSSTGTKPFAGWKERASSFMFALIKARTTL